MMLKIHKQGISKHSEYFMVQLHIFDLKWFRLTFIDHNCIIRLRKLLKEEITDEFNSYSN
jgi:hypothetical protein